VRAFDEALGAKNEPSRESLKGGLLPGYRYPHNNSPSFELVVKSKLLLDSP
jgi:hypothetical protein